MAVFKDLSGQRFGRLVVVELAEKSFNGKRFRYYWLCRCDCGNFCTARTDELTGGNTRSCGCLHKESAVTNISKHHKHKMSGTPAYKTWHGVKARCYNVRNKSYARYGGRGVGLYEPWISDFHAFYEYVSQLEHFGEEGYSLDRIDNDGDYAPGNLRWADAKTQARNRRSNVVVEYNGQEMTLTEASERSKVDFATLRQRLERGEIGDYLFRLPKANNLK